jgi:hypothetical protein
MHEIHKFIVFSGCETTRVEAIQISKLRRVFGLQESEPIYDWMKLN